jgi:hypothetical protein
MRTLVVSDKTKVVRYRTVKLKVGKFTVIESYTDGELTAQDWSVVGGFKNTHKKAYEPKRLYFQYYEDISFLDSDLLSNTQAYYDVVPKPILVTDWDNFKGLNHVICNWTGMDSNIYRIDRATPISTWRYQDYIGGFSGNRYHILRELKEELETLHFIRNVVIVDIPHYNGGGKAVEFEYKTSVRMFDSCSQISNTEVAKIAKKYRRKEYDDDY